MDNKDVPYIVYESTVALMERHTKRLVIALIICFILLFASNALWLYEWCQYDYGYESIEIESDDGNANYIGHDGGIVNGESTSDKIQ